MAPAVFQPGQNGRFLATELARGPWDPNAQHGGAPAALLMRGFEGLLPSDDLQVARVTYEFIRPAPLGELELQAGVVRAGRRVALLEATLRDPQGTEIVRARALAMQRSRAEAQASSAPQAPGPEEGTRDSPPVPDLPFFGRDALDVRFVAGTFRESGPATAWFRLRVPLLEGEEPSALQRLAAAADFGNGISSVLPWEDWVFINPDLTLYVERPAIGEWIGLESRTVLPPGGVAVAESILFDRTGRVGRAVQALLVAPR